MTATISARRTARTTQFLRFIPLIALATVVGLYFGSVALTGYRPAIQLEVILNDLIPVAFVATGASFIFAIGSFDLSLGANMLLCAVTGALVYNATGSLLLMLGVCLFLACAVSLVNYLLASVFRLPVFIMTVAMMTVLTTITGFIIGRDTVYLGFANAASPDHAVYTVLESFLFRGGLLLLYVAICCFVFYLTGIGRQQKFLGGNPVCAGLSGVSPVRMAAAAFTLAGIGIGLAAFCVTLPTGSVTSSTGASVGMNMLIAIVFGGMSLSGGPRARVIAALIGAATMSFLDEATYNFLMWAGIGGSAEYVTMIVKAVLFLITVTLLGLKTRPRLLPR